MKYFLIAIICFLQFKLFAQQNKTGTIQHNGLTRDYRLYIPKNYNPSKKSPLVINMHGLSSNAMQQEFYGDFRSIADTAGFLLVHPNGTVGPTGLTFWNVGLGASSVDDVGFISALIDTLSSAYKIDEKRIYATGMSNGGFMSYLLACATTRFAAIASVTGSMTPLIDIQCRNVRPTPIMEIHGTADNVVPYNGTTGISAIADVINFWIKKNACDPNAIYRQVPNTNTSDNAKAEHYVYKNNQGQSMVEHYKVIGGEHTWPGAIFPIGVTCQDFNASVEIWRFFNRYSLISAIEEPNTDAPLIIQPNPAHDILHIVPSDYESLRIRSIDGRLIGTHITTEINISMLPVGTYILEVQYKNKIAITKFIKN